MDISQRIHFLRALLSDYSLSRLQMELDEILSFYEAPKVIMSIVGSKCSGKCALTNSLIGNNLLPVSLFKPNVLYSLSYGDNEIALNDMKGNFTKISSLSNIGTRIKKDYDSTVVIRRSDVPFLSTYELKTGFDLDNICPSSGYLLSDIVILCTNATKLFSVDDISTINLLSGLGHRNIIICVTHIECISSKDVQDLLKHIESKHFEYPVIFFSNNQNYKVPNELHEFYGVGCLLKLLKNAISDEITLRKQHADIVASMLNRISEKSETELLDIRSKIEKQKDEKYAQYLTKQTKVEAAKLGWSEIRINYEKREGQCISSILSDLNKSKEKVSDRLFASVITTPNPKEWWEKMFPITIKNEINNLTSSIDGRIQAQLVKDFNWVNNELQSKYRQNVADTNVAIGESKLDYVLNQDSLSLKNLRTARYVSMASGAALASAMFFVVGPVGAIASASVSIIGDKYINKSMDRQKDSLKIAISNIVDDVFIKMADTMPSRVHNLYNEILCAICAKEKMWDAEFTNKEFICDEQEAIVKIDQSINKLLSIL